MAIIDITTTNGAVENRNRVQVRFIGVTDGNLVVGGEATSLASLKALVAEAA